MRSATNIDLFVPPDQLTVPASPYEDCYSNIVEALSNKRSSGNAKMAQKIFPKAVANFDTDNENKGGILQLLVAGAIVIQSTDNRHEDPNLRDIPVGVTHREVTEQLRKNGFDARIIDRVELEGIINLIPVRHAMENEVTVFESGTRDQYDNVSARSNGMEYIARLFDPAIDTSNGSIVHKVNLTMRILLDMASVKKDLTNPDGIAPNVVLKTLKQKEASTLEEALKIRKDQVEALTLELSHLQTTTQNQAEKLVIAILLETQNYLRRLDTRAYLALRNQGAARIARTIKWSSD